MHTKSERDLFSSSRQTKEEAICLANHVQGCFDSLNFWSCNCISNSESDSLINKTLYPTPQGASNLDLVHCHDCFFISLSLLYSRIFTEITDFHSTLGQSKLLFAVPTFLPEKADTRNGQRWAESSVAVRPVRSPFSLGGSKKGAWVWE